MMGDERFWARVDRSGGPAACWPYMGARNEHGYGVVRREGRNFKAHRWARMLTDGTQLLPTEAVLHSCDNPPCCNPAHTWVGTQQENIDDMHRKGRRKYVRKPRAQRDLKPRRGRFSDVPECIHGHPLDEGNTILKPNPKVRSGIERVCRTCRRRRNQEQAANRKAARAARKAV